MLVKIKAVVPKNCLMLLEPLNRRIGKYTAMTCSSRLRTRGAVELRY